MKVLRMTTDIDAKLTEQGRKLFAGDWQFFWASPSIETLPEMAGIEVAFAGRSNVGKSSLINALTGRNNLARTSHTPGRTQELIFFEGPDKAGLRLVDMPGYGYASAPKSKVASWTELIHKFLLGRASLAIRECVTKNTGHGIQNEFLPEGAVAWAIDKVRTSEEIAPLIRTLLDGFVIVPDLETALRLASNSTRSFVTLAGEVLTAQGILQGGQTGEIGSSVLQRKNQIAQLDAEGET